VNAADKLQAIADELKAHPERWTRKAFSRDANYQQVMIADGCSWCSAGFLHREFGWQSSMYWTVKALFEYANELDSSLLVWNDREGRTVTDVIAAFEKAAQCARY